MAASPMLEPPRTDGIARSPRGQGTPRSRSDLGWGCLFSLLILLGVQTAVALERLKPEQLWSLQPLSHPVVPKSLDGSTHPIDCFLGATQSQRGLKALGAADRLTWLRRVHLDLVGLPPSMEDQKAFLADSSSSAEGAVVDRLLASEQHGVRYGRHWLDVLRYADLDEHMPAESGIYLWRDWVIAALNQDLPYDQFVRAQISGNRAARRQIISAAGHLTKVEPRPEDVFALGFLARGAMTRANADHGLAFAAVETVSSAFLGLTVACARCHDHFYDPISQRDYYSMKALFDPLVLHPVDLATPQQVFEQGRRVRDHEEKLEPLVKAMREFVEPYHRRLYEERLLMMPAEVQAAIRKPERQRNAAEQKIYEDYYPILRIDPPKIKALMKPEEVKTYEAQLKQINELKAPEPLPRFWTVVEDAKRAAETNYVLVTGDPARPKLQQPVSPGFPFAPRSLELREGRREAFVDWLTAPENPLFARVAVNRVWAWHFGAPLHASLSDFGALGGVPVHAALLDWLAGEFVSHQYSLKWLHRLIVTSRAYQRASAAERSQLEANHRIDPDNRLLWRFPLRRLEAEPILDSIWAAAGHLDLSLGGPSYDSAKTQPGLVRRAAYMARGYRSYQDALPDSLETFDGEDGRVVCPRRNETVTPTQALFLMNHPLLDQAAGLLAERLQKQSAGDLPAALQYGYQLVLGRPPSSVEADTALRLPAQPPSERLKGVAWMLFNLDEFLYVR